MGEQLYGYGPDEHEYRVFVPELCDFDSSTVIHVSAHGGGTVGEEYAGNGWDYLVTVDGQALIQGRDLRSSDGRPAGHAEMARVLASFLAAAGESFCFSASYGDSEYAKDYNPVEAEWLAAEYERLGMFATEGSE